MIVDILAELVALAQVAELAYAEDLKSSGFGHARSNRALGTR